MFYVSLVVIIKQKFTVETKKNQEKGIKTYSYVNHHFTKEGSKREK